LKGHVAFIRTVIDIFTMYKYIIIIKIIKNNFIHETRYTI